MDLRVVVARCYPPGFLNGFRGKAKDLREIYRRFLDHLRGRTGRGRRRAGGVANVEYLAKARGSTLSAYISQWERARAKILPRVIIISG